MEQHGFPWIAAASARTILCLATSIPVPAIRIRSITSQFIQRRSAHFGKARYCASEVPHDGLHADGSAPGGQGTNLRRSCDPDASAYGLAGTPLANLPGRRP